MKFFVLSQVAAVLIVGLALRWLCAHQGIGQNQLLLIDGAVVALALAALAYGLNRLLTPYELIRRRVAEAVRAKTPRSVTVDGFAPQRDLAREIDTLAFAGGLQDLTDIRSTLRLERPCALARRSSPDACILARGHPAMEPSLFHDYASTTAAAASRSV